jgi:hypothetical protein
VGGKGGWGQGGEMTQALYAHMNNKIKKIVLGRPSMMVYVHPSYLGARDQEDRNSRPAWTNSETSTNKLGVMVHL